MRAQDTARAPTGREIVGLPALNFSSDEGVGYGALLELYDYGNGVRPYRYTIQPTLIFSTKGRRDLLLFIEAPHLGAWRLGVDIARELHLATPYYGLGNRTAYDTTLEQDPNPYWYRYGRRRTRVAADVQRQLGVSPMRVLLGAAFVDVSTKPVPFDSGNTLFANEWAGNGAPHGRVNYARVGLVWDTRDREIGPTRGVWAEGLVQQVTPALGATATFTRYTGTVRAYVPLRSRLTAAFRVIEQQTAGTVPVWDLTTIQSSYKQQDGLGGSGTVRGVVKDRFTDRNMFVWNNELRWRFADFRLRGKPSFLLASGFVDAGRVWGDSVSVGDLFSGLHAGYGGGVRLGLGPSFVVAVDVGHSREATQLYIGLGYPY